ncbi:MAG: hypothetical protein ACT4OM_13920 [Actinomycetota bacterium]
MHPARIRSESTDRSISWSAVAKEAGLEINAGNLWEDIDRKVAIGPITPPDEGHLAPEQAGAMTEILRKHTTSGFCWFAIWTGYGSFGPVRRWPAAAILSLPYRDYVLLKGPIEAAVHSFEPEPFSQSPNIWWPEDRAWCVATEIDLQWTYVGGSADCIEEVVSSSAALEAFKVRSEDAIHFSSCL